MSLIKKYLLYLFRWQLSTPILAVCIIAFAARSTAEQTIIANLIGGLIFFWVDRWIFKHTNILSGEIWEVRSHINCADCGSPADRGYRLVKSGDYDRTGDKQPQFRCHVCSRKKYETISARTKVATT